MSTRLQYEHARLANATQESRVQTVIELYDLKLLSMEYVEGCRRADIKGLLGRLKMKEEDIEYWLDFFKI